jgi:hypothetical protein
VQTKSTKTKQEQNRNKTDTTVHTQPTKRRHLRDVSVFCPGCSHVNPSRGASRKEKKNTWAYAWLRPALHYLHQEYKKRGFWVRPTQRERKILTQTSLPHATFGTSNPRRQHIALRTGWRYRNWQHNRNLLSFTGRRRNSAESQKTQVAEMLHKCCRTAADLSRSTEFLFCQFIVDPASSVMHI